MKKVRLAIGAVGAIGAAPALGLLPAGNAAAAALPTGNTAAAATHTPASTGKTVVLHGKNAPDFTCTDARKLSGYANGMYGAYYSSGGYTACATSASIGIEKTGLAERVRYWFEGIQVGGTHYVTPGYFLAGHTIFSSDEIHSATSVCEALVNEATLAVKYGPVCE
jgi:hypothetical protein